MATPLETQLVEIGVAARDRLPANTFLSVNVSPEALLSSDVQDALASAEGGLGRLVIEVTEQSRVEDYAELARALARSRAAGAAVAVDDTGAGYASLAHVMRLRPEFVKLDRGLVADADLDPAKLALIEAVGAFAARLDAWIVAEGIERRAEQELLIGLVVPHGDRSATRRETLVVGRRARSRGGQPRHGAPAAHPLSIPWCAPMPTLLTRA
jgi:EAL domain-containing protein (putative c-di-GMP-specific phosphodiesterase class I)